MSVTQNWLDQMGQQARGHFTSADKSAGKAAEHRKAAVLIMVDVHGKLVQRGKADSSLPSFSKWLKESKIESAGAHRAMKLVLGPEKYALEFKEKQLAQSAQANSEFKNKGILPLPRSPLEAVRDTCHAMVDELPEGSLREAARLLAELLKAVDN